MTSDEAVRRYGWVSGDAGPFGLGGTIALAQGVTPRQSLEILVPDRRTEIRRTPEVREWVHQHYDPPPYRSLIEAGTKADWTLAVEDASGYRATEAGMVEALSRNGAAVVVYRSLNADMLFRYASAGVLFRSFDPLGFEIYEPVGSPLPEEGGLGFGRRADLQYLPAALLLVERLTGVQLSPEDLRSSPARLAVGFHPR